MGTAVLSFGPKLGLINNATIGEAYYDQLRPFLRAIDNLIQASVLNTTVTVPPPFPNNGDAYLLLGTPSGIWTGKVNQIAVWTTQATQIGSNNLVPAWDFYIPNTGWIVWADNLGEFFYYTGSTWEPLAGLTSVALSMPSEFTVTGSPITSEGTFTVTKANQAINSVYAGPPSGSAGTPAFRNLVFADLPAGVGTVSSVALSVPAHQGVSGSPITTSGTLVIVDNPQNANSVFAGPVSGSAAVPAFRTLVAADLPVATTSILGAVKPDGTTISITDGVISAISGTSGIDQLTGDVTSGPGSGSQAATVIRVNGAAVPISALYVATNSSGQLVATSLPTATTSNLGIVKPDGTTVAVAFGVITSTLGAPLIISAPNGGTTYTLPLTPVNPTRSFYFVNGLKRIYGSYYSITGNVLTILFSPPPNTTNGDTHEIYAS